MNEGLLATKEVAQGEKKKAEKKPAKTGKSTNTRIKNINRKKSR